MSMKGTDVKGYKLLFQGVGNHQILNVIVICPNEDDLICHVASGGTAGTGALSAPQSDHSTQIVII